MTGNQASSDPSTVWQRFIASPYARLKAVYLKSGMPYITVAASMVVAIIAGVTLGGIDWSNEIILTIPIFTTLVIGATSLLLYLCYMTGIACWAARVCNDDPQKNAKLYHRHIFILGVFLITATAASVYSIASGLRNPGSIMHFHNAASLSINSIEGRKVCAFLAMSVGLSWAGTAFYVASSMASRLPKNSDELEPFSLGLFWGKLFTRCAESALLVLVVFFFLLIDTDEPEKRILHLGHLPMIGLLGGMFIKTFEAIIFGFAKKLFLVFDFKPPEHEETRKQ